MGDDPVHLTPLGYTALAESLIETANSEAEPLKAKEAPQKDMTKRREGIIKSDWTASRWGPTQKRVVMTTSAIRPSQAQARILPRKPPATPSSHAAPPPPHSRPGKKPRG